MTNRTVQFWGQGYGATPCTITAYMAGVQVFAGDIPTLDSTDRVPTDQQQLFSWEIPMDQANTTMTLALTGSDIYLTQVLANYSRVINPIYLQGGTTMPPGTFTDEYLVITNPSSTAADKLPIWEKYANPALTEADITLLQSTNPDDAAAQEALLKSVGVWSLISSGPTGFVNISGAVAIPWTNVTCTNANYYNATAPDPLPPEYSTAVGSWSAEIEPETGQTAAMQFTLVVVPGQE